MLKSKSCRRARTVKVTKLRQKVVCASITVVSPKSTFRLTNINSKLMPIKISGTHIGA